MPQNDRGDITTKFQVGDHVLIPEFKKGKLPPRIRPVQYEVTGVKGTMVTASRWRLPGGEKCEARNVVTGMCLTSLGGDMYT